MIFMETLRKLEFWKDESNLRWGIYDHIQEVTRKLEKYKDDKKDSLQLAFHKELCDLYLLLELKYKAILLEEITDCYSLSLGIYYYLKYQKDTQILINLIYSYIKRGSLEKLVTERYNKFIINGGENKCK